MKKGRLLLFPDIFPIHQLNNRARGFQSEIMDEFPEIELIHTRYSYDDDWVAGKIVEELIEQYPNLSGIYITGPAVKGICEALEKTWKRQIY
mgnify:CR=1 FL=1